MSENIPENINQNNLEKNQTKSQIKPSSKNIPGKNPFFNESNTSSNATPKNRDFNNIYNKNSGQSLLKNVQYLDEENSRLKELLSEMKNELRQKEEALNDSQKIILKLKDEYSQIMKEYKKLETEKNKIFEKKESNQKILNNISKTQNEYERVLKLNDQLKQELIRTKENLNYYKSNFSSATNDLNKLEKHNKTKEMIINDLKIEGDKCVNMLQDRDLLIESYSKKINELNSIISQKNDQLKLMVNFSKEINNENKSNVKEITKQAVKTIKVFYNTLNNKDNKNQVNFIEIKNNNNLAKDANNDINNDLMILSNLFDNKLNSQKCSTLLQDSLKDLLYIPEEGANFINKEFLIDNNFKTSLIKTELYSSLIRENNLYNFLKNIFGKLDTASAFNTGIHEKVMKMNDFKFQFFQMKLMFENYYKENSVLKNKLKELKLYIEKLKNDMDKKNKKYKEKINELMNLIELNENNLTNEKNKDSVKNNIGKLKNEISNLNSQMDKINNEKYNLTEKNKEKDDLINNLKKEIEKLNLKINSLRTNPLAENNINYLEKRENSTQTDNDIINMKEYMNGSNSFSRNKKERNKYYLTTNKKTLEIQSNERFTYYLESMKKENNNDNENEIIKEKENLSLNYITPIKINKNVNNNINNNINEKYEINSFSKLTNLDNILEVQQNSDLNNMCQINNNKIHNSSFKEDFKKELNESNFITVANKNISISKSFSILTNKIEHVKNIILSVKEKIKKMKPEKKISPHNLFKVLNHIEKYITYIFIYLNQSNGEILSILPTVSIIYNLISKYIYKKPFQMYNDMQDNIYNFDYGYPNKENYQYEINNQIEDIKFDSSSSNTSKENIIPYPNIQELKQFFDINKKIFSSSELIKYRNMYINLSISQIIKVFKETCNNLKKTIHNLRQSYKINNASEYSDFSETTNSKLKSQKEYGGECDDYRIVNEKILNLKKFEFDFKILMELLKNYLVCFEIVVRKIEKEKIGRNKANLIQLGQEVNIIYNLFEDVIYYKIDELDDDIIFNRKVILKLVQNHKEFLTIMFDLRY
jgi:hypothetical protein